MNDYLYILSVNGLLFFFSVIFYFFPPKKINDFYGYRTNKSKLNEDIWQVANSTFNKNFLKYSGISFLGMLVFHYITNATISWQPMVLLLLTLATCVIKTEQLLRETFDEEGKRKKNKK